ncbi:hypothetical protein H8E77_31280, partial [bacterium]|nr:hypothetical protein [bacterium]
GSELDALKIIAEEGGNTVTQVVSRRMGIGTDYARILCNSLGRADYIDLTAQGQCILTDKGRQLLDKQK